MTGRLFPVTFIWREVRIVDEDGVITTRKVMDPLGRFGNVCGRQFAEGEEYTLAPLETRSRASHNHYFAALNEGFQNLPQDPDHEGWLTFPTSEHFRKWALCKEGFCTETNYVCENEQHARRMAALCRRLNEFVVITIKGNIVRIYEAKSQSAAAMGAEEFMASKRAVLELLSNMIGVRRRELEEAARKTA